MSYSISPTKRSQPCLERRPRWKKLLDLGKRGGKYKVRAHREHRMLRSSLASLLPRAAGLLLGGVAAQGGPHPCPYPCVPQSCLSRQQLLAAIRQMQQLLKGQETRFSEGLRAVRSRLSTIHASLAKAAPEPPAGESLGQHSREIAGKGWLGRIGPPSNSSPFRGLAAACPALQAPADGRKFGTKYLVDHEVHFACDPGFQLLGSSTRICQANGSWTGQEARCAGTAHCLPWNVLWKSGLI